MAVSASGILIYQGDKEAFEIVGGVDGQINLKRLN